MKTKWLILVILLLVVFARFGPHPWNFSPVAALMLFGGLYFKRWWMIGIPMVGLFISDIFLGLYDWQVMASVYAGFALVGLIGFMFRKKVKYFLGGALLGSVIFFVVTNFVVWLMWYPNTWAGIVECYILALPFFRNSLLGDLFYSTIFVGVYQLSHYIYAKRVAYNN